MTGMRPSRSPPNVAQPHGCWRITAPVIIIASTGWLLNRLHDWTATEVSRSRLATRSLQLRLIIAASSLCTRR
jgi:hypothetical protein